MLGAKRVLRVDSDSFVMISGFELGPWQIQVGSCGQRELYEQR